MAEINLGNIKFNWKGAYAGGTAYVVDDVVSSAGSSYVCILASTGNTPPNGTYWNLMAEAGTDGTNGTDVLTTLTTTGDMLYRDGSGAQRLGIGTAGQELKVNSGATAPEWYTPVAGGNSPLWLAKLSGTQTGYANNTYYDLPTDSIVVDSDNAVSTSPGDNYQFVVPSGKAGKYFLYINIIMQTNATNGTYSENRINIQKATSAGVFGTFGQFRNFGEPDMNNITINYSTIVPDCAVGDRLRIQFWANTGTNTYDILGSSTVVNSSWGGFYLGA